MDILDRVKQLQAIFEEGPRSMNQEPRNMYSEGQLVQNTVDGSRPGYSGPLTGDKFKEIVTKYPDKTNQELLDYFNKNKFTNRYGEPLNLNVITTNKTKFFDLAAETKAKIPKNYIISTEVFENLPISKKDYFRVKQAKEGGTLLTKEIDKLLTPIKVGDTFYFKNASKRDLKSFNRLADKTGRLNNRIADLMIDFDKAYGSKFFSKGNVPDIKDVAKKFNITDSTAGKVTTRLAQWYGGQDFKNTQLQKLQRNKVISNRMFKTIEKSAFGNPYRDGLYQISMQTIDAKLGNKQGTFEKFKSQAKQILKDNKIAIYDPKMGKDAFGFNINEIAGVTGSAKSKAAEFSQFVDVMEGNLNTKTMAGFQSKLSTARANIEKAKGTKNYKNVLSSESKRINDMAIRLEKQHGVDLPRLRDPDATKYFLPQRIKELNAQGIDIVKAAERAGYTIEMPKGAVTIKEFTEGKLPKSFEEAVTNRLDQISKTKGMKLRKGEAGFIATAMIEDFGKLGIKGVKLARWLQPELEPIFEGLFYQYAKQYKGLPHDLAREELFLPKILAKIAPNFYKKFIGPEFKTGILEGADPLLEKELYTQTDPREFVYFDGKEFKNPNFGKPTGKVDSKTLQYINALKDQDRVYDAFAKKEGARDDFDLAEASADVRDLAKTGTISNINRILKPGSMTSQAYNTAVEKHRALEDRRKEAAATDAMRKRKQKSFDIYLKDKEGRFLLNDKGEKIEKMNSRYKQRYKDMEKYKDGRKETFGFMSPKDWEKYQTTFPKYKNIPYEHPELPKFADYMDFLESKPEGYDKTYKELFPTPASRYDWDLSGEVARAGGVANMATGGRAGYMGGGITAIRRPNAIPPERQGLRSILINGKKS